MAFRSNDISIFFRDGETCVVTGTGQTAKVHLDFPEEIAQFGGMSKPGVVQGKPAITYATDSLTLVNGTAITIDGVAYKIAGAPRKTGDGLVSVADLNKG